jgi:hypothetical protein
MKKLSVNAAVISLSILGTLCSIQVQATPMISCQELTGEQDVRLTPSGPAAVTGVQSNFSILNVYVRGQDDRIYQNAFTHAGFSVWNEVPGGGLFPGGALTRSEPAAAISGNVVELFIRGTDNRIYENNTNDGTNWSGWFEVMGGGIIPIPGLTLSGLAAVLDRGALKLFERGTDDRIYETDFNSRGWFEVSGGGRTISAPAAISYRNDLYLFVRGFDNRIYRNVNGTIWREVPGNGLTLAGPSALIDSNGTVLKLFVTGLDDGVWENDTSDGTNWSGWSEISTHPLTPSAPAAVEAFSLAPELFLTAEDGRILECNF